MIVPLLKGLSNDENRKLLVAQGILQAFTGAKLLKAVVGNYRYTVGEMGARFAGCKEILGT